MSCVGDDETAVTVEAGRRNDLSSAVTPKRASSSSTLNHTRPTEDEMTDPRPFGFTVRHDDAEPPSWTVGLPHQCDEWLIAGSEWGDRSVSQADAVAELERFIAEAQHALDELRGGRELAGDDLKDDWDDVNRA
jgi:hypothetical protein